MKAFINNLIPKLSKFSEELDTISILTKHQCVILDEFDDLKVGYIFREKNNQLLISKNGVVQKSSWEYLGGGTILIESPENTLLLKQAFVNEVLLILQIDGTDNTLMLVNASIYHKEGGIKTIEDAFNYLDNTTNPIEKDNAVDDEKGAFTPEESRVNEFDFEGNIRYSAVFKHLFSSQVTGIVVLGEIENPNMVDLRGIDIIVSFTKADGETVFRKVFPLSEMDNSPSKVLFEKRFDLSHEQWKEISGYTKPEFSFLKAEES